MPGFCGWDGGIDAGECSNEALAPGATGEMGLSHLECGAGQTAVEQSRQRFGVETGVRHTATLRRLERLPKQPVDRLVPFARAVHGAFLY
jgi:hypothetical protein